MDTVHWYKPATPTSVLGDRITVMVGGAASASLERILALGAEQLLLKQSKPVLSETQELLWVHIPFWIRQESVIMSSWPSILMAATIVFLQVVSVKL